MGSPNNSYPHLSITDWCVEDRPREKYATKGASFLSDAELIAILLRTGNSNESAVDIAKKLLHTCDNQLNKLSDLTTKQLLEIKGIGPAKAITLQAAFELGRRLRSEKVEEQQHIRSADDVIEIMQERIAHLKHEEFWTIYLNQSSKILDIEQIGKGGLTNTAVDLRLIFQKALALESTHLIVCHNHPSGSTRPSEADIHLTKQIREAANFFNITLTDHIILHKGRYYSFRESGAL